MFFVIKLKNAVARKNMNWALGDRLQPSIMRVQNFQNVRRCVEDLIMSRTPKELLVAAEISSRLSGKRNVDK